METIRRVVLLPMGEDAGIPPDVEVDGSFQEREAYREGRLTDAPDLSPYDDLLEEDDDG